MPNGPATGRPTPGSPALSGLAAGAITLAWLGPHALTGGGLAALVAGGLLAGLLLAPLAVAEWRSPPRAADPVDQAILRAGEAGAALAAAAVGAGLIGLGGQAGLALVLFAWTAVYALANAGTPRLAERVAVLAVAAIVVGATQAASAAPPWTLLMPAWGAWRGWAGPALTFAVLASQAGLGHWPQAGGFGPRAPRAPFTAVGLLLLLSLPVALALGADFEANVEAPVLGLGLLGAVVSLLSQARAPAARDRRHWRWGVGVLATLWLAGPAAPGLPALWVGLGLFPALAAAGLARRSGGAARVGFAALALGLVGWVVLAWPGWPASPGASAALAVVPLVILWGIGTPAARALQAEAR